MEMLAHAAAEAKRLGMQLDMATGTGWPFGGPTVKPEDADAKLVRDGGEHRRRRRPSMKVKRAAPGGAGLVLNPFSPHAMTRYLASFDDAVRKRFPARPDPLPVPRLLRVRRQLDARPARALQAPCTATTCATTPHELFGEGDPDTVAQREVRLPPHARRAAPRVHEGVGRLVPPQRLARPQPGPRLARQPARPLRRCRHPRDRDVRLDAVPDPRLPPRRATTSARTRRSRSWPASPRRPRHVTGKPLVACETFTWLREHFRVVARR